MRLPDPRGVETPIPGTRIVGLPYDRDSVLRALEARAPEARPHTETLDSLFQAFREPFGAFAKVMWRAERLRRTRDSLATAGATAARAALDDSLERLQPEIDRARRALDSVRRTSWDRIDSLRAEVRRWEQRVYRGYDTIVGALTRDRLREPTADTTDAVGRASLRLGRGRWWIHARSPDPDDPHAEWYWNLPVGPADTVVLNPASGERRPRY